MKRQYQLRSGRLRSAALVAAAVVGLAAAPAAQAAKPHSVHGVVAHLGAADRATARLAAQPTGPLAAMYLARAQAQTALAGQLAQAIKAAAHGKAGAERAATALGLLADHQTSEAQTFTSLLGSVRPELQAAVAQAITAATGGREGVLGTLGGLLPQLSTGARPVVAQIVAVESSQGAQVPSQLAGRLGANSLACTATGAVQQALVVATQAFQLGLANLGPVLGLVNAHVQAQVQSEIDGIPALLHDVEAQLAQSVPCSPAATAAPAPVSAVQAPTLLGGMTELIDGILGHLLPGLSAGQTPPPVATPSLLSGLFGGLFGGGH